MNTTRRAAYLAILFSTACNASAEVARSADFWGTWPAGTDPATCGQKIAENLLTRELPFDRPTGMHYAEAATAYGSLRLAATLGDKERIAKIVRHYQPILTDAGKGIIPPPDHVDTSVFGILPLEIFIVDAGAAEKTSARAAVAKLPPVKPIPAQATAGASAPRVGRPPAPATLLAQARDQWAEMKLSHADQMTRWLTIGKTSADTQWASPRADGLTDQTRMWVDDMFMIIGLQCQAYRATGDRVYLDRAAKEMVFYLDQLQQTNGLFFHAADAKFYWGRGDGWVAVGMAEILSDLPADHPQRAHIMQAYKKMMAALLKYQAPGGMWRQLIDNDASWEESSATGMFTFAMALGVKNEWLDDLAYKDAAKKAWIALSSHIDGKGNVTDVCIGTGKGYTTQYYLARQKATGDFHGQAGYVWAAWALAR